MTRFEWERVHVLQSPDPDERQDWFRAALRALVVVEAGERIAIKPNLGSAMPDATGATTALWMIEEAVVFVRERGAEPIVVEGPSHIHDFVQVMEVTGGGALFDRLGVEYVDGRTSSAALEPFARDRPGGRTYHVHREVLAADGIICLPKLKTHNRTGVTLGIKGLMGLLALSERHGFHRRGVSDDIVQLYKRLRGRIRATFVDGIIAMEGDGPTLGRPVPMNVILGGRDTVSVDAVGALLMGFDTEDVDHIRVADELGLGDRRRPWRVHPSESDPLPVRFFERPRPDSGLRTQLITFPPISAALRAGRIGVRGRTKPIRRPNAPAVRSQTVADACPTGAITAELAVDYGRCIGCGLCIAACPEGLEREGRGHKLRRVLGELLGA